jgi:glycosyltransferase involved in cell wall biosynthesis
MRIAFVTPRYPPLIGGVEKHVERIAQRALARGHQVRVLTQNVEGDLPDRELLDSVPVQRLPLLFRSEHYAISPQLAAALRGATRWADVIHTHNYHGLPAAIAAGFRPATMVFTPHYHGTAATPFRRALHKPYRLVGAATMRRARRVICVSRREAELLTGDFPWSADRVSVIHNGVDVDEIRAARPFPVDGRVLLSAGRLEAYKGVDRTIRALADLGAEWSLRITGDGPARPELEALTRSLKLDDRVEFLGQVSLTDLHRWFRTASAYVTMSRIEAMPLTPLEVLAAGVPVVASTIDAHREVAQAAGDGVTMVPAEISPGELAGAIRRAAESRPAATVLSWPEVGDRTLQVYREALERTGSAAA